MRQSRESDALREFVASVANGHLNLHGADARNALETLQGRARQLLKAVSKTPCGECHLNPGETCDICGAKQDS